MALLHSISITPNDLSIVDAGSYESLTTSPSQSSNPYVLRGPVFLLKRQGLTVLASLRQLG